jgi:2-oxoglutarate ferredoxin oxidoreductase subunit beta
VSRAFIGDVDGTRDLLKRAISHKGCSLVDILQHCGSFNKVNTCDWFKEHTCNLEKSHDPGDREEALRRAMEPSGCRWGSRSIRPIEGASFVTA